ncbi:MAG: beta-N-acetylhexosaminidase [Clostridia bacterium]
MLSVIPKPNKVLEKRGSFIITSKLTVNSEFSQGLAMVKDLFLGHSEISIGSTKNEADITIKEKANYEEEKYLLDISPNGIEIFASGVVGVFYALQTLRQIAKIDTVDNLDNTEIGSAYIMDSPRFEHRGFMLDEARHFFGMELVKKTLDMMAMLKLNVFHWHLTDDQGWRIEIKKYPLLTQKGSIRRSTQLDLIGYNANKEKHDNTIYGEGKFYTQKQIKEVVAYASKLNISVIPEIDMPGHLIAAIACYPELSCFDEKIEVSTRWGVMDTIGCMGKPNLMEFVKNIIDEVVELFPAQYFHIGGDEVPKTKWKKCEKCQAKIKELGLKDENALQGYFNNEVLKYLQSKGKKLIGWDEILEASALSSDVIAQYWEGNASKNGVADWLQKGNKIIISYNPFVYMDHFYSMKDLPKFYSMDLDTTGLDTKYEQNVLGMEAPQWTEYVRDITKFNFNTYPRMQALAEICWTNKENKNFEDFDSRLQQFLPILDKLNIGYAPREIYICKGIKGYFRKGNAHKNWIKDPNFEMNEYYKIKKTKNK